MTIPWDFSIAENLYYNVTLLLVLNKCLERDPTQSSRPQEQTLLSTVDTDVFEDAPCEGLWSSLFSSPSDDVTKENIESKYNCEKFISYQFDQSVNSHTFFSNLSRTCFFVFISISMWIFIYYFTKYKYLKHWSRVNQRSKNSHVHTAIDSKQLNSTSVTENDISTAHTNIVSEIKLPLKLLVFKNNSSHKEVKVTCIDATCFLASTIDRFLNELDLVLGLTSDVKMGHTQSLISSSTGSGAMSNLTVSSSRPPRRRWRRPGHGSPSLPLGDLSHIGDTQSPKDKFAWNEIENLHSKLGWMSLKSEELDFGQLEDRCLKDVLSFYIRNCPIDQEQASCSTLIVNYILLLLGKELQQVQSSSPFKFVEFKGIGSVVKGLKNSKANHFDVAMIIQPTECCLNDVLHNAMSDDIPPGRVAISVKDLKELKNQNPYTKRASIENYIQSYLLPFRVLAHCKKMLEETWQGLVRSNRSCLDRLSFCVQIKSDPNLEIVLDTRMLHGLGLGVPEIGIRICPALPLITSHLSWLPPLYAIPPKSSQQAFRRPSASGCARVFRDQVKDFDQDLFWSLSFCDLETSYLAAMDEKFKYSNTTPCHRICTKTMKALFSSGYKTSLLSRGEVDSYHIETVMFFLLLESSPSSWSLDKLADRLSDAIHFLRSSLQSMWLPNFFIHNPHLQKQLRVLMDYPLLSGPRQDNLFANMKVDTAEKALHFIDQRLLEVGLTNCVKKDFSTEMWEYEFFIFG